MLSHSHQSIMALLAALSIVLGQGTDLSQSVALSDFVPRVENLPSACQQTYTSKISSCVAGDFLDQTSGKTCSRVCLDGLVRIGKEVQANCATAEVSETSIIGEFLQGNAIELLCPGVVVTTIASSAQFTTPAKTSATSIQVTSVAQQSSAAQSSAAQSSAAASSSAAQASSTQATSTLESPYTLQTSALAPSQTAEQAQSSSASASATSNLQKSNQDSGGGSPFDIVATGSSSKTGLGRSLLTASATLCTVAFAFFLL